MDKAGFCPLSACSVAATPSLCGVRPTTPLAKIADGVLVLTFPALAPWRRGTPWTDLHGSQWPLGTSRSLADTVDPSYA